MTTAAKNPDHDLRLATRDLIEAGDAIIGSAMNKVERFALSRCETIIERGQKTFVEVGNALLEIRDKRLYRATRKTFEDYCRERWGWRRDYATKLIQSVAVMDALAPTGGQPSETLYSMEYKPATERQARPLTKLNEPEQQRAAWKQATEAAAAEKRPVTGKDVEAAVTAVQTKKISTGSKPTVIVVEPEEDSEPLCELKRLWRRTVKQDRARFLAWAKQSANR